MVVSRCDYDGQMRVRLFIGAAGSPGIVAHAAAVAERLAGRGHDAEVWAPHVQTLLTSNARRRVRMVEVPSGVSDPVAWIAGRLADLAGSGDVAHIHHAQDATAAVALIAARADGVVPAVVRTVHHLDAAATHSLDEMQRASLQDVDARVCVSTAWAQRLLGELSVDSVVIPNGVDRLASAAATLDRDTAGRHFGWGGRPAVLTMGGISRRKGSRVVLEAFARASARLGAGALLVVAGESGDDPSYRQAWLDDAERLGLTVSGPMPDPDASVAVLGAVSGDELPLLYRAVDVLAHPSTREGSGMLVLEAALAGVPAVVGDIDALRGELADGRDCLMVPPGHSGPLAEAIVRLARDEALRRDILAGAVATGAGRTWDAAAQAHERLYARVLAAPVPAPGAGLRLGSGRPESRGDGAQAAQVGGLVVEGGHRGELHRRQGRP